MLPKISIITPSYNQGHFIEQTITSILDQGYPNLEYIIMDGGSKDNTVEVIKKYEKHINYWVSERDKGQSDAINKGFRMATGEVINWLNSDDYYEKGALHKVGEAFSDPKVNVFMGISRVFGKHGDKMTTGTDVYTGNLEKTIGWARIDQPETFFRKSCLDAVGYADEQFHYVMDKELWIRYLIKYGLDGIKKTNDHLTHFRIHDDSKTNSFGLKFNKESLQLYQAIAEIGNSKFANIPLWPSEKLQLGFKSAYPIGKQQTDSIINYNIYYIFLERYAQDNYKGAKELLPFIDEQLLRSEDSTHFSEVKRRMKMPVIIKKLYNKIRS
ncbi:MAG: glycosyltransferase [Sphingobacteriales bacterium]|nr:MAG: glycosyltransferase [Sphingobacteriales bacterium]